MYISVKDFSIFSSNYEFEKWRASVGGVLV